MMSRSELVLRAQQYAQRYGLTVGEQLGLGIHGIVLVVESQQDPGRSAIKVHERQTSYCRERDVYLRLRAHEVTRIFGSHVPQLLRYDDELWVIEMAIVRRPFVLDFAGAYLDAPPDYPEEALAEWIAEKQEQFGDRWSDVESILWALEKYGVYLVDVSPGNVAFGD